MTDNEKMREAFFNAFKDYRPTISFRDFEMDWDACMEQAAQAVPVDEDRVISIAGAYESGIGHCNDNLCNPYKTGSAESFAYDYGKEFGKAREIVKSVPGVGDVQQLFQKGEHGQQWVPVDQAELERLRKDAERYRWLRDRMVGAHFDFDDEGMVILAFEMPDTARISADCDETIDSAAAIAAEGEK